MPHLTPTQIILIRDNENHDVLAVHHFAFCPRCQEQVRLARQRELLFRQVIAAKETAGTLIGTHPSGNDLGAYIDGGLPDNERIAIETHLRTCSLCQEEVSLLEESSPTGEPYFDGDDVPLPSHPDRTPAPETHTGSDRNGFRH